MTLVNMQTTVKSALFYVDKLKKENQHLFSKVLLQCKVTHDVKPQTFFYKALVDIMIKGFRSVISVLTLSTHSLTSYRKEMEHFHTN